MDMFSSRKIKFPFDQIAITLIGPFLNSRCLLAENPEIMNRSEKLGQMNQRLSSSKRISLELPDVPKSTSNQKI